MTLDGPPSSDWGASRPATAAVELARALELRFDNAEALRLRAQLVGVLRVDEITGSIVWVGGATTPSACLRSYRDVLQDLRDLPFVEARLYPGAPEVGPCAISGPGHHLPKQTVTGNSSRRHGLRRPPMGTSHAEGDNTTAGLCADRPYGYPTRRSRGGGLNPHERESSRLL